MCPIKPIPEKKKAIVNSSLGLLANMNPLYHAKSDVSLIYVTKY